MLRKMEVGQTLCFDAEKNSKTIAEFGCRGKPSHSMDEIVASLTSNYFWGEHGFKLAIGDSVKVTDRNGNSMQLQIFKIVAGMPILARYGKSKNKEMGLMEHLLLAWQALMGRSSK